MTEQENWHQQDLEQVLSHLGATPKGLTSAEAQERLQKFGLNRLPTPPQRSSLLRFLLQFHNILIYVLLGSALITGLLAHWVDTFVILAVVMTNAIIGFIQEGKAEKAMDAIREMLAPSASVIRNGIRQSIKGEELVPGDLVLLEPGDKVPADLRLLESHGLQVQEAILTGESLAVEKDIVPVLADAPLGDRTCLAFSGTLVTHGQGKGLVIETGGKTEIGRISNLLSEVETLTTPLVEQMDRFARWLTLFILAIAIGLLIFGTVFSQYAFSELFMAVVGLAVAAIPEGMPAVITITLSVGVQAMARRNAIVRRLPAIETLGSISVICSDKTGTLTRNEMSVVKALTREALFSIAGNGYDPRGEISQAEQLISAQDYALLAQLGLAAALCNDAELNEQEGLWHVEGDPMEGALLAFANKTGLDIYETLPQWKRTDYIPFDFKNRFMATLNHDHQNHACILVKGAPEKLLQLCSLEALTADKTAPLDRVYWQTEAEKLADQGQRVLALALKRVKPEHTVLEMSDLETDLTLIGLVGLLDPPRPEAIKAVRDCHQAGIRVKMITGDHAGTATAIGKEIGLRNPDRVLTGSELDQMDDAELYTHVLETDIFARTSPEHKLRLVTALQSHGMIVAMTGDGVNDAPALKRADAGIAMGLRGSEAAKEASELVLADDNFASIAAAVREGRTVYDNIKKVISWTLPTNAGEAMTIVAALLLGINLPITPVQILWVNLVTAVTLGIALAFEPTEENSMRRPPRQRNEALLTPHLIWHIVLVSSLILCGVFGIYTYALSHNYSQELANTLAMNTLVVLEIFHMFFIRNIYGTSVSWKALRATNVAWLTVSLVMAAQLTLTYLPFCQTIFATQAVSIQDWGLIFAIGTALFLTIEIEKQFRQRLNKQV
ncbi:MAG: cation-transporting P-type ATPase [Candidatus Sericytochromatia bacterium]